MVIQVEQTREWKGGVEKMTSERSCLSLLNRFCINWIIFLLPFTGFEARVRTWKKRRSSIHSRRLLAGSSRKWKFAQLMPPFWFLSRSYQLRLYVSDWAHKLFNLRPGFRELHNLNEIRLLYKSEGTSERWKYNPSERSRKGVKALTALYIISISTRM